MKIMDAGSFFEQYPQKLFYVGFLKSGEVWFPMCSVSDPRGVEKFDSLYVALDFTAINELVQSLAKQVKGIENTFVHYLLREEVQNIMGAYDLKHVVLAQDEEQSDGCGCGCGCQHGFPLDGGFGQ